MGPGFNPDGWLDILAYGILTVPAIIAAIAAVKAHGKAAAHKDTSEQTLDQVKNDHDTNLRDDIDEIRELLRDGFSETRKDIGGLREELRTERLERIEGDRRPGA